MIEHLINLKKDFKLSKANRPYSSSTNKDANIDANRFYCESVDLATRPRPFTATSNQSRSKASDHQSEYSLNLKLNINGYPLYTSNTNHIIDNLFKTIEKPQSNKVEAPNIDGNTINQSRPSSAARRRNYLDYIETKILNKKLFDFTSNETNKNKENNRSSSSMSKSSVSSNKTYTIELPDYKIRPLSCINTNKNISRRNLKSANSLHTRHIPTIVKKHVDVTAHDISDSDVENIIDLQDDSSNTLKGKEGNHDYDEINNSYSSDTSSDELIADKAEYGIQKLEDLRFKFLNELEGDDASDREKVKKKHKNHHEIKLFLEKMPQSVKTTSSTIGVEVSKSNRSKSATNQKYRGKLMLSKHRNWATAIKLPSIIKFRKAVRMVMLLLQAVSRIRTRIHLTAENSYDSIVPQMVRDGLIFDLNAFRRPKEIGLAEEAKRIMRLPQSERTDELVRMAVAALIQAIPEYADFPINIQRSIVKVCHFERYEAGRVIIRQGHKADNFYFIVSGITIVTKSDRNPKTGEPMSRTLAYLSKGKTFGELAIMHQSARNATVTCHTDVSVLTIERDDFIDIFMHVEHGKEPEHISYLRQCEQLDGWPISKLPYDNPKVCLLTYFRKGLVMCKDSNKNDWLYILKNGSCKVIKALEPPVKPVLKPKQSLNLVEIPKKENIFSSKPKQYLNDASVLRSMIAKKQLGKSLSLNTKKTETKDKKVEFFEKNLISSRVKHQEEEKSNRDSESSENRKVYIEVQQLYPKDVFGLVHVVFGSIEESTSVTLVSEGAECILINKAFFVKNISDDLRKKLRETVRPYPSDFDLQSKLQVNNDWNAYRNQTIKDFYLYKRKVQESLFV